MFGYYADQGGSDRKLNKMPHSTGDDASNLNSLIGEMRTGEFSEAVHTTPFLYNAFEQFDALHVMFGTFPCSASRSSLPFVNLYFLGSRFYLFD